MKISNIRLGFATNSSSSHSIIFVTGKSGKYIDDLVSGGNFGWEEFCAASEHAKAQYLAQTLFSNISGLIGDEMAKSVASDWGMVPVDKDGYVDHQSMMTLPSDRKDFHIKGLPSKEFFMDLLEYYKQDGLVIVGGNDNSSPEKFVSGRKSHILPTDRRAGTFVCRKDGDWWTLMNRHSGAKIRLCLKPGSETKQYVKASSPELVDMKITDFCPYNCSYCYQGSTKEGKHADSDFLHRLIYALDNLGVFEVAIGGGEPTLYPNFASLLDRFRMSGIIPNFTTKNPNWMKDPVLVHAVKESAGRFAFSVTNLLEMYRVHASSIDAGLINDQSSWYGGDSKRLSFQYVMGSTSKEDFMNVVRAARKMSCDLTLLGFKEVGRGVNHGLSWEYSKNDDWLTTLLEMKKESHYGCRIGIDTTLAQQSKEALKDKVAQQLVTYEEGAFSMYIDAVARKMGPSSFCKEKEYVKFAEETRGYSRDLSNDVATTFRSF